MREPKASDLLQALPRKPGRKGVVQKMQNNHNRECSWCSSLFCMSAIVLEIGQQKH